MQGKSRLFIGFTAVLLLSIFVLFHSSQRQMDELRVAGLKCEQHEMALRAQYDGHVEKLAQLERSLEISRTSGDGKLRAEKDLREKALKDANLRFSSLQHHYKSLKSEHEDAKSEWGMAKQIQQEKINSLTKVLAASEKQWKLKNSKLEIKFNKLEAAMENRLGGAANPELLLLKNQQLMEELKEMQKHCPYRSTNANQPPLSNPSSSLAPLNGPEVQRSFDEQVLVAKNTYQIPIHILSTRVASNHLSLETTNRTMDLRRGVLLPVPSAKSPLASLKLGGIINSVENFQILPKPMEEQNVPNENVLKEPGPIELTSKKSSTPTIPKQHGAMSLDRALPIAIIQEQSSVASKPVAAALHSSTKGSRKVPDGVVPIPDRMNAMLMNEEEPPADIKNARYSNVGVAAVVDPQHMPAAAVGSDEDHNPVNFLQNGNERENRAHEVNDFNIVEDRNHHDHLQEVLEDEKIVINNNAAEVEAHPEEEDDKDKRGEIDLAIINRDLHGGDRKEGQAPKKGNDDFVADQGFDDRHEEPVEEEDDDEYPNLAAQQEEGPAVRN